MILKWGSYTHGQDEVGIRITVRSVFDTFNRHMGQIQDWHILGAIHSSSQADLTSRLTSLEAAYNTTHQDLCLYLSDGTTKTRHEMKNADQFGGNVLTGFGYIDGPWKMRCEYANRRTFWATIRGEQRFGSGQYAWRESITIKGTGAMKWRYMPQLVGPPTAQTLQTQTPFYYVQEGMAIGREAYIVPPGPIYPGIEHAEMREIKYITPRDMRIGPKNEMFTTTWRYVMEATADQGFTAFGIPTIN